MRIKFKADAVTLQKHLPKSPAKLLCLITVVDLPIVGMQTASLGQTKIHHQLLQQNWHCSNIGIAELAGPLTD